MRVALICPIRHPPFFVSFSESYLLRPTRSDPFPLLVNLPPDTTPAEISRKMGIHPKTQILRPWSALRYPNETAFLRRPSRFRPVCPERVPVPTGRRAEQVLWRRPASSSSGTRCGGRFAVVNSRQGQGPGKAPDTPQEVGGYFMRGKADRVFPRHFLGFRFAGVVRIGLTES